MSNNQLQSIPTYIGQLLNLNELDLSGNQLQSIPTEIGGLLNLKLLSFHNNKLQLITISVHLENNFSWEIKVVYTKDNSIQK